MCILYLYHADLFNHHAFCLCRIGVEKGRQLFRSLLICCSKNKKEWKDAQNQVEDLKRQLEEAERLAVQKKEQFDKSRKQVSTDVYRCSVSRITLEILTDYDICYQSLFR